MVFDNVRWVVWIIVSLWVDLGAPVTVVELVTLTSTFITTYYSLEEELYQVHDNCKRYNMWQLVHNVTIHSEQFNFMSC